MSCHHHANGIRLIRPTVGLFTIALVLSVSHGAAAFQPHGRDAPNPLTEIQTLSKSEQHAFAHVLFMALAEQSCRSLLGRYVPLDELLDRGCTNGAARVPPMAQGDDPRSVRWEDYREMSARGYFV